MQLYSGMSEDFIKDTMQNRIAEKLRDSFFRAFRYEVPKGELNSWRNSLRAVCDVFEHSRLHDHGVILEYQLPSTSKRLDVLVCGENSDGNKNAVIVELKQWERCTEAVGDEVVCTFVGGNHRDTLHPSVQVRQYQLYLADSHTAFHEGQDAIHLSSCAYLHNYAPTPHDFLFDDRFQSVLTEYPSFTADDFDAVSGFLSARLNGGKGHDVLRRIEGGRFRPSKKLMDHVGQVIKGLPEYVLLDEQRVVYQTVLGAASSSFRDRQKHVIVVRGGPGTGKSVIALNLMSDLLLAGRNAHYATGSKAFTETLRSILGARAVPQLRYFMNYQDAELNAIDVLICDESHRIRKNSFNRFTPKSDRTDRSQIQEIIDAAKVAVFFIDDKQVVRPDEIGSSSYILDAARENRCVVREYQLHAQFRCAGSDGFVNWINNTLGIERTANVLWETDEKFDFRIMDRILPHRQLKVD